jgi:hypothetical protein
MNVHVSNIDDRLMSFFSDTEIRIHYPLLLLVGQSFPTGTSSSKYRMSFTRISVLLSPLNTSLKSTTSHCICTISNAPLKTPHNTFEYHNLHLRLQCPSSSSVRRSRLTSNAESGSSTNSASGFSSRVRMKDAPGMEWD